MLRKKTTFGFALTCVLVAFAIAFAVGFLVGGSKVKKITDTNESTSAGNAQIEEIKKIIDDNYLGTINEANLSAGMCKGYVDGLGDNSVKYLTAQEYENYNKNLQGETIIYRNFGKGIGYMQFTSFTDSTKTSFSNALNDFSKSSISKVNMLVFDLRNCTTGDVQVAAQLLDMLLPEGETIAGIDKKGVRTTLYTSDQAEIDYDIAVLVNDKTKGAAEIFAATLNAYGKAVIVGTTTAGDCAQTEAFQLKNGDYVLIPNLYYVTKGQQTYSTAGVVPTTVVELSVQDQKTFDSGMLDIAVDPQFLEAVKALGVNDVVMPGQSDTDTDTEESDSKDTDNETESQNESMPVGRNTSSRASSDSETSSGEELDPYWDDDEYWNSQNNNGGDDEDGGDDYDEGDDEEYYDEDWE